MNRLTELMLELCNRKDLQIIHGPIRTGDIVHSYGDIRLAKEMIGFQADYDAVSGFKEYLNELKKEYHA
jgi:UDP-glucose 4-epimerase